MIPREIRKKLETSSLPDYVLNYLTEKFNELEKYCEDVRVYKKEAELLERQLRSQEQLLQTMLLQQNSGRNQTFGQQDRMGYQSVQFPQRNQRDFQSHHRPWEYEEYPGWEERGYFENARGNRGRGRSGDGYDFMMEDSRGGSRRNNRNRSSGNQSDGGNQGGQSGNQGGSESSQGGGTSAMYVPEPERVERRNYPVYREPVPMYEEPLRSED